MTRVVLFHSSIEEVITSLIEAFLIVTVVVFLFLNVLSVINYSDYRHPPFFNRYLFCDAIIVVFA